MERCSYNDAAGTRTYSFFAGFTQVHGERASVAQLAVKEKTAQRKRSKRLSRVIQSWCIFYFRDAGQGCFIPSKRARHRAPTTNTVQDSYEAPPSPLHSVQIQNFGFVQASFVLGQNSQQNHPWGLTLNSQQGSNRGVDCRANGYFK